MRRICIYWLCLALCASSVRADEWASVREAFTRATESPVERRVRNIEEILNRQFQTGKPSPAEGVPSPKLSVPVVTYRTETRYRSVPYTVKICPPGQPCRYETRYYQQAYTVQVAVASSQYVLPGESQPEAASTPMPEVQRMVGMVALPAGSVVLDPGAGRDARVAIELARRGYSVLAFEIDGGRYRSARKAIRESGYDNRIRLVHGDVTKYEFDVDGVVAYMYPDVLQSLAKRLKNSSRFRKFISYQHDVEGLNMVRSGDIRVWTRPTPQATFNYTVPRFQQHRYPVASSVPGCRCQMCAQNRRLGL